MSILPCSRIKLWHRTQQLLRMFIDTRILLSQAQPKPHQMVVVEQQLAAYGFIMHQTRNSAKKWNRTVKVVTHLLKLIMLDVQHIVPVAQFPVRTAGPQRVSFK